MWTAHLETNLGISRRHRACDKSLLRTRGSPRCLKIMTSEFACIFCSPRIDLRKADPYYEKFVVFLLFLDKTLETGFIRLVLLPQDSAFFLLLESLLLT